MIHGISIFLQMTTLEHSQQKKYAYRSDSLETFVQPVLDGQFGHLFLNGEFQLFSG